MNDEFLKDNINRTYFNLSEILAQPAPGYNYKKYKNYHDKIAWEYELSTSKNREKLEKNRKEALYNINEYVRNKKKIIKVILRDFGIDLEHFKKGNNYKLPITIAELIYVLADADSYRGTNISKLKLEGRKGITYKERIEFTVKWLKEIVKDYLQLKSVAEDVLTEVDYLYIVYCRIDKLINTLKSMCERLFCPVLTYSPEMENIYSDTPISEGQSKVIDSLLNEFEIILASMANLYIDGEFDESLLNAEIAVMNLEADFVQVLYEEDENEEESSC